MTWPAEREEEREQDGRTVLLSSVVMLLVAGAVWFAWQPASTAAEDGGFGMLVLDAALCGIFVLGVQNVVFGLIPLRFMEGQHLFRWRSPYWAAVYLVGVFGLVHVLLHPNTAPQGMDNEFTADAVEGPCLSTRPCRSERAGPFADPARPRMGSRWDLPEGSPTRRQGRSTTARRCATISSVRSRSRT